MPKLRVLIDAGAGIGLTILFAVMIVSPIVYIADKLLCSQHEDAEWHSEGPMGVCHEGLLITIVDEIEGML